jgi:tRNA pseudouridine55 synthase
MNNGFLFIDKPSGPSSFGIIKFIKKLFAEKKVGHLGTLDPLASGILICGLGKATRLLYLLPQEPKTYIFGLTFGAETDTLDSEGEVVCKSERIPEEKEIIYVLQSFTGPIKQVPPAYSAIKINGRRAYKLARKKENVYLKERDVFVFSIKLVSYDKKSAKAVLQVDCSSGTYIRALARDIARKLNTFGYADSIRRISVGNFDVCNAVSIEELKKDPFRYLKPVKEVLNNIPSITISKQEQECIVKGRDINVNINNETLVAYKEDGEPVALLTKTNNGFYHPQKVLITS